MKHIKYLVLITMLATMAKADSIKDAESILNGDSDQRELASEQNSTSATPPKQEDGMKCYPVATVKRWAKHKRKPCPICAKSEVVEKVVEKEVKVPSLKNRVRLIGGVAPNGTALSVSPTTATLSSTSGLAVGIGYDRLLGERLSVEPEILTNGSALINVGLGF